ncbi:acyl-CoA dehydrogenase family protein [Mycobacterium avium]|uniref:acyl-CoA dehydrogenase family protein n=1 Tax=Mycobacterium avium TaxID=1764 RepID=UPI000213AFF1|nr:acyl-CoA dehydrogenase family protein [Mycobacterium avium]ETB13642.1 acyl-CoA dehydrogenase [Mycobacterium avium subsp. paratuberculosis 08-8281]ETB42741.1 acyl-CoA dehydrogenase [Mycobacterium avium subsp. paratuberculosis 11-1786]AZP80393.1 acyl-CoA dehydrogenase [Mycobacterium avium subsp. paratuberculosis]QPM70439.1 acyl-CoA/acyl-ACP dehydrogenase [Mycobacterium avium subsp. paratuberculosis S397]QQK49294.1 acyl-CoA/acyl-ACP dehydrogenase [Mycobacterium avium subsp. paratuberculosis]
MIEWSDTDLMVRDAVRQFVDKEIRPHLDELESGAMSPYPIARKLFSQFGLDTMAAEAVKKVLDRERSGVDENGDSSGAANEFSGGGAQGSMIAVLVSEIARVSIGLLSTASVSLGLGAATIASRGTLAQKERWLPELMTLEKIAAWAITEPDSGSDAFGGMKTSVRRSGDGDGAYILNGQKTFITNGPYADVLVVYAKLDEGDPSVDKRNRPVLVFVLDAGMPGLTQGKPFKKMGMMSSPTGELFFDNVRLTPDRLLGESEQHTEGDGRDSARANFAAERIGIAMMALGIIDECHRLCVDYAKSRTLWGKNIGQFQLIQLKLAKMEIARMNVQNMVFHTIERQRAGKPLTLAEASAIKLYSSEAATEVAMEAVQLFGGNGYMAEYRVEQLARDAKSLMIYAGSNEVQVTHIAKGLLSS